MKTRLLLLISACLFYSTFTLAQTLIDSEFKGSKSKSELTDEFGFVFKNGVEFHKITYTTLDVAGVLDTASGLVVVPDLENKMYPMLCYQHGTIGEKTNVPSNLRGGYEVAAVWGGLGFITFAPDLLGLGESRGFHPYVHADSEASAAIDMLYATRTFLTSNGAFYNEQLFISGYSQGGHSAAALQKELEENYGTELPIIASAPMSGPYSISGVMWDFMVSYQPYSRVGFVPYTFLSYQMVYGNIYTDLEDIFKPTYVDVIDEFSQGEKTFMEMNDELNTLLIQNFGDSIPLKMVRDDVVDSIISNPNHPFNLAMEDNDVHDFVPQAPTRFFYCQADEQVPFRNSLVADSTMNALGAIDVSAADVNPTADHLDCVRPALLASFIFFSSYQRIDEVSEVKNIEVASHFSIFPNPASELFFIKNEKESGELKLISTNGKVLLQKTLVNGNNDIDVSNLVSGIYFLKINYGDSFFTEKIFVKS